MAAGYYGLDPPEPATPPVMFAVYIGLKRADPPPRRDMWRINPVGEISSPEYQKTRALVAEGFMRDGHAACVTSRPKLEVENDRKPQGSCSRNGPSSEWVRWAGERMRLSLPKISRWEKEQDMDHGLVHATRVWRGEIERGTTTGAPFRISPPAVSRSTQGDKTFAVSK